MFCGCRTYRLQKELFPEAGLVVDQIDKDEADGLLPAHRHSQTSRESINHDDRSEDEFGEDRPDVAQNDRVFNLHGQGKPIAELDDSMNNMTNTKSGPQGSGQVDTKNMWEY